MIIIMFCVTFQSEVSFYSLSCVIWKTIVQYTIKYELYIYKKERGSQALQLSVLPYTQDTLSMAINKWHW